MAGGKTFDGVAGFAPTVGAGVAEMTGAWATMAGAGIGAGAATWTGA